MCTEKPLRFGVTDVYTEGKGVVARGRVMQGFLEAGERLVVLPIGDVVTVNKLEHLQPPTIDEKDKKALKEQAIKAARASAKALYGADHVADAPRVYQGKSKNAQEAHEAIRPAGDTFKTPGELAPELSRDEFALYDLIWKRTVASQMAMPKRCRCALILMHK